MNTVYSEIKKSNEIINVTQETARRLIKDVRNIVRHPLADNGIYYVHDDSDMFKGVAMVIGPSDTIYSHGFYFFTFDFPSDYPHSPPKVTYHTNDGVVRFHPNLYRNGKVCLSILNTWQGEQWSACQSLRSVLLTLVTLFHNKPLLCEPGIKETHKHFQHYNEIIEYKNWEVACFGMINKKFLNQRFLVFEPFIFKHFFDNKQKISESLEKLKVKNHTHTICDIYYKDYIELDYAKLYDLYLIVASNVISRFTDKQ